MACEQDVLAHLFAFTECGLLDNEALLDHEALFVFAVKDSFQLQIAVHTC